MTMEKTKEMSCSFHWKDNDFIKNFIDCYLGKLYHLVWGYAL